MGNKLRLSLACSPYDRVRGIMDGISVPDGIDLNFIPLGGVEVFWRQLRHYEFDASELSLSSYMIQRSRNDNRFICIPVFTSRMFRHSCVYINKNKGINKPSDIAGKIVGVPEYQITAALWLRGIFQDEYGIKPSDVKWRSGGEEQPGRVEKLKINLPDDVEYEPIPEDKTLSAMLDSGEIDVLFTAGTPSCFAAGSPNVGRLFENYIEVEKDYYRKTNIFPIMHTIAIKREIYEKNPWIAMSLYKAFNASKNMAVEGLYETGASPVTLPWLMHEVERTRSIMGDDWWPYGIDANRKTLETMCRYSFEQGLSERLMTLEELFAPETFDEFRL